ncbi:MAG: hypothetical protein HY962_02585 [Ignavibacteriae bacterium]|nr:hypothetical protein [Ignavibacteriota bacterium]
MGRHVVSYTVAAFLVLGLLSCGKSNETKSQAGNAGDAAATQEKPAVAGSVKDGKIFSILVPEGWQFSEFNDGTVQTYNNAGTFMVQAKKAGMNMTDKDVETNLTSMMTQYKGTAIENVDMLGLTFLKTTYDASGSHQTLYGALKDGMQISIQLMGPGHETDATIQGVLASIRLR